MLSACAISLMSACGDEAAIAPESDAGTESDATAEHEADVATPPADPLEAGPTRDASGAPDTRPDAAADASLPGPDASDASTDAGPTLPPVECKSQAVTPGSAWHRCTASPAVVTPGGPIATGTYNLQRSWKGCGTRVYIFGSAEIYTLNGDVFMRYFLSLAPSTSGTITADYSRYGTWFLETDPATGALKRTELCDGPTKGKVETGTYASGIGLPFVMSVTQPSEFQESWVKQ